MKKIIFIAIILFSGIQISNAQHSISTNYTNNYIGHDFDLNYNYMIKKHKVLIGTSFLLNQKWQNEVNSQVYYKQFHAFNFGEHFGFKIGYQYHFPLKNNKTAFFVSFDSRYRYGQTRKLVLDYEFLVGGGQPQANKPFFPNREFVSNKMHAFSNQIGGGIQTYLFHNIYLNGQVGVGVDSFINTEKISDKTTDQYLETDAFNLSFIASLGIEYKFQGKKKKKE